MIDEDKPVSAVEGAIAYIEKWMPKCNNCPIEKAGYCDEINEHQCAEQAEAHEIAISALREKAAREATECEYCNNGKPEFIANHYCPMCGRRLAKDE